MILFPYAKDIDYDNKELSFTLQFFDDKRVTDIQLKIEMTDELADLIEKLSNLEN